MSDSKAFEVKMRVVVDVTYTCRAYNRGMAEDAARNCPSAMFYAATDGYEIENYEVQSAFATELREQNDATTQSIEPDPAVGVAGR